MRSKGTNFQNKLLRGDFKSCQQQKNNCKVVDVLINLIVVIIKYIYMFTYSKCVYICIYIHLNLYNIIRQMYHNKI